MAKLKAPLLSLGARGQLAKALVFFPWKGLNLVREYVIPSNPRTTAQVAHRAHLTTVVAAIHTAQTRGTPLDSNDQIAYSALAQAKGIIMTWFNQACKLGIDALVAGDGYTVYRGGSMLDVTKTDYRPIVSIQDDGVTQVAAGKFYLGTSKTNLITASGAATINAGGDASLGAGSGFAALSAGVKYYWQFRPDAADPCEGADSGIYYAVAQ